MGSEKTSDEGKEKGEVKPELEHTTSKMNHLHLPHLKKRVPQPYCSGGLMGTFFGIFAFVGTLLFSLHYGFLDREEFDFFDVKSGYKTVFGICIFMISYFFLGIKLNRMEPSKHTYVMTALFALIAMIMGSIIMTSLDKADRDVEVWDSVKNLKNFEDERVEEAVTFTLALFSNCCFRNPDDIPDLSCDAKGEQQPCVSDAQLFEQFDEIMFFDSDLCSDKVRTSSNDKLNSPELCDFGEGNYTADVGRYASRILRVNRRFAEALSDIYLIKSSIVLAISIARIVRYKYNERNKAKEDVPQKTQHYIE